ncbi:anti-phage protein Ppl [Pantoea agglomerans]|uniref:anti-phage protein Ppl n=1 Tax=Enterobacter agglomerans TaxID=549 RepID=UPI00165484B5|nr:anti-phage protein Ppl [Pantoea agglomerans]
MSVGSRWYKFDFHNHTPASNDYRMPGITDREWLLAYMRQQVDCVIISDHNTGARIDQLKNELQQMARDAQTADVSGYRPLTLFPGVELTATGNVHILAVLHTDCNGADVERLIGQCNNHSSIPRGEPNHQLVLQLGSAGIISAIRQHPEALCILAHIDAVKGILSLTNQGELEDAFRAQPHAVELRHHPDDITDGTHKRLIKNLPRLRGSDAHHPDQAGARYSWLKMSSPDFDGLRHALLDHENCVLFDVSPPEEPALQLRSLRLRTRLCAPANNEQAKVDFSPFYNAVIGSRGSGKSTLIESIRLAMRKTSGLTDQQNRKLGSFKSISKGMETDSVIECVFRKDGADFKLSWRPGDAHALHILRDGEWAEDTSWAADRFPLSIFSQKMLYELASDNSAFLRVCDDSTIVNKRAWGERWDQLEREFKNEQIMLRGHSARRLSALSLSGELADADRAVSQLSESAYYPVRQRLSEAEGELFLATSALKTHSDRISALNALMAESFQTEVPAEPSAELAAFLQTLSLAQLNFERELSALLSKSSTALTDIGESSSLSAIRAAAQIQRENVIREAELLRAQGLNPDTLNELIERCDRLRRELKEYDGLEEIITASEQRIRLLTGQMREHRIMLTEKRREFIASLQLQDLDIKILPLCAPHENVLTGYQNITGITNFSDRIYDAEDQSGLLHSFISNQPFNPIPSATEEKYILLDALKSLHLAIKNDDPAAGQELHGTFRNRLRTLQDETLDSLMSWYPDDGIFIRYRAPDGRMEDITSASPGQKGASMLQFLLSYGTDPLLLDQPEDDLDCLMLSQSVIPAIAANKKRRQLIIVSHSAPIVVNGDAEYVISMKYDRSGLRPDLCGALQDSHIKALICQQMEGGEKAFRSRYARILS